MSLLSSTYNKIKIPSDPDKCWTWVGLRTNIGNPKIIVNRVRYFPHRVLYEVHVGPLKKRERLYRTCINQDCVNPNHLYTLTPEQRFWSKVDKTLGFGPNGDCWIWIGTLDGRGYGTFAPTHGDNRIAHRYSYLLANGPFDENLHVLHQCDTPLCVNPSHLTLGTNQDNVDEYHQRILGKSSLRAMERDRIIIERWINKGRFLRKKEKIPFYKVLAKELDCSWATVQVVVRKYKKLTFIL